jgi:hypothetical protein
MRDQERYIITSVWNDLTLRMKLDDNPYSLSQDELMSLQNNDRLNYNLDCLMHEALIKKATIQVPN